jgi:hypothetical protein
MPAETDPTSSVENSTIDKNTISREQRGEDSDNDKAMDEIAQDASETTATNNKGTLGSPSDPNSISSSSSSFSTNKQHQLQHIFERIHPACITTVTVGPPGLSAADSDFEDFDELNVHADLLIQELKLLEASNYVRLQSVHKMANASHRLNALRIRKTQLNELLTTFHATCLGSDVVLTSSIDRNIYASKPLPLHPFSSSERCPAEGDYTFETKPSDESQTTTARYSTLILMHFSFQL